MSDQSFQSKQHYVLHSERRTELTLGISHDENDGENKEETSGGHVRSPEMTIQRDQY